MRSTTLFVALWALFAIPISTWAAENNHIALVFTGHHVDRFEPPAGSNPVEDYKVRAFSPGVELIVVPKNRVSFGLEYKRLEFETRTYTGENRGTEFQYIEDEQYKTYRYPEETLITASGYSGFPSANALIGNIYLSLGKSGSSVQPFIGGGYGVGFTRNKIAWDTYVDPIYQQYTGFQFGGPNHYTISGVAQIVSVKGGVRSYWKNLAVGGAVGYQNGPIGQFEAGIVF